MVKLAKDGPQVVEIERKHNLRRWIVRASSIRSAEQKVCIKFGDKSPIGEATCYSIHTTRQFNCNNQFVVTAEYRWGRKSIQWQDPRHSMPDASHMVLLSTTHKNYPVWPGHWDGGQWRWCEGGSVEGAGFKVIAWAEMPEGPTDGDE